jgi:DNA-binding CsgD family transcriptional regulator
MTHSDARRRRGEREPGSWMSSVGTVDLCRAGMPGDASQGMTTFGGRRGTRIVVGDIASSILEEILEMLRHDRYARVLAVGLDGPALEDAVVSERANVVILDENVPYSLVLDIKARPFAPVVAMLVEDRPLIYRTILHEAGVECLQPGFSREDLRDVSRVFEPAGVVSEKPPDSETLTEREVEVLGYLRRKDLSYAEIAVELGVTEATVKTHSATIRRKLGGVKSRREL